MCTTVDAYVEYSDVYPLMILVFIVAPTKHELIHANDYALTSSP